MRKTILIIMLSAICIEMHGQNKNSQIIIEVDTSLVQFIGGINSANLPRLHVYLTGDSTRTNDIYIDAELRNARLRWVINSPHPVLFTDNQYFNIYYVGHPGDSIYMAKTDNAVNFSGIGAARYRLLYEIEVTKRKVKKPDVYVVDVLSIENYLQADKYYDQLQQAVEPVLNSFSHDLSTQELTWARCWTIEWIEYGRMQAFLNLGHLIAKDTLESSNNSHLAQLKKIWRQSHFKPWTKWLRNQQDYNNYTAPLYFYQFTRAEVWLRFNFNMKNDSLGSKPVRTLLYYENIKKHYKGHLRERVLNFLIDEQVIVEMGPSHPMTKQILKDYYELSGFASYKSWIKSLEKRMQNDVANWAPSFELTDKDGNIFTNNQLRGKIAILDFWFTGCKGCVEMVPAIKIVKEFFKNDTNVVFLEVSVDANKNKWLKSIDEKKYTSGQGIQLYTSDKGAEHSIVKNYGIQSYPTLVVIDAFGKLVTSYPPPDARGDNGKSLIALINQQLIRSKDGPYIFYEESDIKSFAINSGIVQAKKINSLTPFIIPVSTDKEDKPLNIELQKGLTIAPSVYPMPEKLLVLSDIEGNFKAFRKLLQAGGVIDENYNWTFGNGHLVLAGDVFDRGEQVTECLWLIYSLEQKAKSSGGFVHFILGNHEIMNLQGDHKYTVEKYLNSAKLLGITVSELYGTNTELGRWLRTKNVMEKIGDLLIIHGGSSSAMNNLPHDIVSINNLARQHYDKAPEKMTTTTIQAIMGLDGPFWYRGFYKKSGNDSHIASMEQINSTLKKFGTRQIITGHTIVADTISVHFAGKVINIDTHHASGKSEALLIVDTKYYRINPLGNRTLFYSGAEDTNKILTSRHYQGKE